MKKPATAHAVTYTTADNIKTSDYNTIITPEKYKFQHEKG